MATLNIEELIADLQQLANEIEISHRIEAIEESVKVLQSQAERIKWLEQALQTGPEIIAGLFARALNMEKERDTLRTQLAAIAAVEPVAYLYEMATTMTTPGNYGRWVLKLEYQKPCVPEGAVRNLQELFTRPMPAQDVNAELVEALSALVGCITETRGTHADAALIKARDVLSKYKGVGDV